MIENILIENILIGFIILDNSVLIKASNITDECFVNFNNKKIFKKIIDLNESNKTINISNLIVALGSDFQEILENILEVANKNKDSDIDFIIEEIGTKLTLTKVVCILGSKDTSSQKKVEMIEEEYSKRKYKKNDNIMFLDEVIIKTAEELKEVFYGRAEKKILKTDFHAIDSIVCGFHNSELIIIAGRTSMGKTALAINIAINMAKNNNIIYFISLEMSSKQLSARILAMESGINLKKIINFDISSEDIDKIILSAKSFNSNVCLDESAGVTVSALRQKLLKAKKELNISCVFIDYLQLLKYGNCVNKTIEITYITQALKSIAKELDLPIIVLSQLSRSADREERKNKIPKLSDLRDSGSIEQDADMVIFIHREAYYLERNKKDEDDPLYFEWVEDLRSIANDAEIIVAKNRSGSTGSNKFFYDNKITKFFDTLVIEN